MKTASVFASFALVAGVVASAPAIAQTEVPIDTIAYVSQSGNAQIAYFAVPDYDTTRSAYGGRLRLYDVHVAKMFELTDYECRNASDRNWSRIVWRYEAGGGEINMGAFDISCNLAAQIRTAYGSGKPEATDVMYYRAKATVYVPILNITGGKVSTWLNFTRNFRPEFGD